MYVGEGVGPRGRLGWVPSTPYMATLGSTRAGAEPPDTPRAEFQNPSRHHASEKSMAQPPLTLL